MDDELGRRPRANVARGVPPLVAGAVTLKGALEVVDGEEELVRVPLRRDAEAAVVADEGLELAAEGLALDPVWRRGLASGWKGERGGVLIMYPP